MRRDRKRRRRLSDGYSFAGLRAKEFVRGVFGEPDVRIVSLERRSKKRCAAVAGGCRQAGTIGGFVRFAIFRARDIGYSWSWRCGAWIVGAAAA